ncbi:uncharacterized protein LOC103316924 [Nasonia vitripennis]|uniref:Uncharacterized protein n=1 Tax=Nasonia vitripennis TaxID=7425 RepID=A0A7M7HCR7_NASVI|nr:uncharacterized protein LOC103316924 [Nasonia vitripennis]
MLRIDFEEVKGRRKLWKWRWAAREDNFYVLDEWLSLKEREDRFHLIKMVRELEEKKTEKGEKLKIRLENKWIKIGEEWFKWNRKEGGLNKITEEETDEEPLIESWKEAMLCEMRMQEENKKGDREEKGENTRVRKSRTKKERNGTKKNKNTQGEAEEKGKEEIKKKNSSSRESGRALPYQ